MKTQEPEVIEQEMARTRSRIDRTIDEIGERVNPEALKSAAMDGITRAREQVVSEASRRLEGATSRVTEVGNSARESVKSHPLAAAVIGIGLGLLLGYRAKQRSRTDTPIIEKHY